MICFMCVCLKLLWPFSLLKKWFHGEDHNADSLEDGCCEDLCKHNVDVEIGAWSGNMEGENISTQVFRLLVGTWNVAGRHPSSHLDLSGWLEMDNPADMYIIGFQEIVPLNAANVLGVQDTWSAIMWETLIYETLNGQDNCTNVSFCTAKEWSFQAPKGVLGDTLARPLVASMSWNTSTGCIADSLGYICIASKQMVGIQVSIWVQGKLQYHIRDLAVSCVGVGLLGCLGNKGAISFSMLLHKTSFCFVCTHLTSGERAVDEISRNRDVLAILKRTRFPAAKGAEIECEADAQRTIWRHDRIIWFGDLNYRVNLPGKDIWHFVAKKDWQTLLKEDQLTKKFFEGNIFEGWQEGAICFAPTYKYKINSDCYDGDITKSLGMSQKKAPAWCDRILWHGNGLRQLSYRMEEYTISDHKPVNAVFLAEVELRAEQDTRGWRQWPLKRENHIANVSIKSKK